MAHRIASVTSLAPTATADGANLVDGTYPHILQGGNATQLNYIYEISLGGQVASSSSPTFMLLAFDSTVGTGANTRLAGQTDIVTNPPGAAAAAIALSGNQWATTKPQRSSTGHLANCSFNGFGGIFFWRANKIEEAFVVTGNVPPAAGLAGEISLSAFSGGTPGALGSHMIYETV
jgi:hypothetical protein